MKKKEKKKKLEQRKLIIFGLDKVRKCPFAFAIEFSKDVAISHVIFYQDIEQMVDIEKFEAVEYDPKYDDFISKILKITEA